MADVYSQVNIQMIFSVKGRENLLSKEIRDLLFPYISGILDNIGCYPLAVNGYKDHVHLFYEMHNDLSNAKIAELVKTNSSKWINANHFFEGKFHWQRGYSAFSYSRSQRNAVIKYLMKQEKHHQTYVFKEEYLKILNDFEIKYTDKYLFEFYEL
jgi:putative transposase